MLLITGAHGMVGSYAKEVFGNENIYLSDIPEMDITDQNKVKEVFAKVKPKVVIHLAAETDVDRCEKEPDHAFRTNTIGTQNIALECYKYDAEMVYIGTGSIFNTEGIHTEYDEPNPICVYAKSKLEGEKIVQSFLQKYYIFRASFMIGGGRAKDKKFVGKIIQFCLEGKKEIMAVNDKHGTPTFAKDLLKGIKEFIKTGNYGLYHLGNNGICSRYDIAKKIVEIIGSDTKVISVTSDKFPLPAPRTPSEAIRNYKLELMGMNMMRPWVESLKEYIEDWRKQDNA